jgi:hypothetical protein
MYSVFEDKIFYLFLQIMYVYINSKKLIRNARFKNIINFHIFGLKNNNLNSFFFTHTRDGFFL